MKEPHATSPLPKRTLFGRLWVVSEVAQRDRDDFADEHCPMSSQRRKKRVLESLIETFHRRAWLLRL